MVRRRRGLGYGAAPSSPPPQPTILRPARERPSTLRKAGADARTARVSGNHDGAERATPACRRRTIRVANPEAEDRLPAVPGAAEIHSSGDRRAAAALRLEV